MANYTQRHIVSVPLKNVKSTEDLYKVLSFVVYIRWFFQVFYGRTINKQPIPVNKRIFVLEDFDAAGLEDVVNNRSETSNEGQNSKVEDVSTKKEETNADTPKKDAVPLIKNEAKSKLTLADLLEVFDGVMEMKVNT